MDELENRIRAAGEVALKELVGQPESFRLEFKSKSDASTPTLSKEDRRNLGAALSGFSNAEGGILIFGIRTRKVGGEDIAQELSPIGNIGSLQNEVDSLLGEYLRPPNPNIDTFAIPSSNNPGNGYLAVFIGRSDNRPHMSMAPGHQKYFRRSVQGTVIMDHGWIRDMMLASREAKLAPWFGPSAGSTSDLQELTQVSAMFRIELKNDGLAMASLPFVRVESDPLINIDSAASHPVRAYPHSKGIVSLNATQEGVLHSGGHAVFGTASFESLFSTKVLYLAAQSEDLKHLLSGDYCGFGARYDPEERKLRGEFTSLRLRLTIGAENAVASTHEFNFSREQLLRLCLRVVRSRFGFSKKLLEQLPPLILASNFVG